MVRQGCPLSPYLFILAAEVLATKIRQDETVRGITIFGTESKISQFADNTSAFCDNLSSVQNLIRIVNDFGKSSGLKLNPSKPKAIWQGPWRDREDQPLNLNWTKKRVRTLWIFFFFLTMKIRMRKGTLRLKFGSLILILIFGDQGILVYLVGFGRVICGYHHFCYSWPYLVSRVTWKQ